MPLFYPPIIFLFPDAPLYGKDGAVPFSSIEVFIIVLWSSPSPYWKYERFGLFCLDSVFLTPPFGPVDGAPPFLFGQHSPFPV